MVVEKRIYLPLRREHLLALDLGRSVEAGLAVFFVTEDLGRQWPDADEEELEFRALQRAAVFARSTGAPVVIGAADVPPSQVINAHAQQDALSPDARADPSPKLSAFCAFHLDDVALSKTLARSAAGSAEVNEEIDLSWYDVSELSHVLRQLAT